jgi:hypothetical protein
MTLDRRVRYQVHAGQPAAYCFDPMGHNARAHLRRYSNAVARLRWTSVTMNTVLPRSQ